MKAVYLLGDPSARWAISRWVGGRWLAFVENSRLENLKDAETVLTVLSIELTPQHLDLYFPERGNQGRCPTRDLLEKFSELGNDGKSVCGV